MYFITTKRMLEVCFSAHPNIQYRTIFFCMQSEGVAQSSIFNDFATPSFRMFVYRLSLIYVFRTPQINFLNNSVLLLKL